MPTACRAARTRSAASAVGLVATRTTRGAVRAASHASAADLVRALVKLYQDNAATLTPDPLHSAFYDSHPPAASRVARLAAAAPGRAH